jgi:hypothetical protein
MGVLLFYQTWPGTLKKPLSQLTVRHDRKAGPQPAKQMQRTHIFAGHGMLQLIPQIQAMDV